jgi:hypothetical protein
MAASITDIAVFEWIDGIEFERPSLEPIPKPVMERGRLVRNRF